MKKQQNNNVDITIEDIPEGHFFLEEFHPDRPKLKLKKESGYFDIIHGVRNLPNGYSHTWRAEPITEKKAVKLCEEVGLTPESMKKKIAFGKFLVDKGPDYQISPE